MITASSAGGTSTGGGSSCGLTGSSYRCLVRMPIRLSASNGTRDEVISYMITPSA